MSSIRAAGRASSSFEEFCVKTPTENLFGSEEPTCLMDLVRAWVTSGEGVRVCNGDYTQYTIALVGIINDWLKDPGITDYSNESDDPDDEIVERRVNSIFGEAGYLHHAFDQYWFEGVVFAQLNPHLREQFSE